MIFDVLLAVGLIAVGFLIVNALVSNASVGGKKASASPDAPKEVAKKPAAAKPQLSKKEKKKKDAEAAELERLIEKESKSVAGLAKEKFEVVTLDEFRERKAQKSAAAKAATSSAALTHAQGVVVNEDGTAEFSLKQKIAERAQGFQIVEEKEKEARKRKDIVSPVTAASGKQVVSKKTLLAQNLGAFFRSKDGGKKKFADDGFKPRKDDSPAGAEETKPAGGGRVDLKRPIGRASAQGLWDGHRNWAAEEQ